MSVFKIIVLSIFKLAASGFWVYCFYTLAKDIDMAVTDENFRAPSSMFDVFMHLGLAGILQSIGALRGLYAWWGGTMETELTTRHFTMWKTSSGEVVGVEEDHSAPIIGCLISLVVGGFLVIACSALLSPIMFIVNVVSVILLFTSMDYKNKVPSILGLILSAIVCIACIGGTIYGWNYISSRVEILEQRREAKRIQQQKEYEAARVERERLAAEKREEEKRLREQKRGEQKKLRAQRDAERQAERAQRQAERAQRQAQLNAEREQRQAQRRAESEARRLRENLERNTRRPQRRNPSSNVQESPLIKFATPPPQTRRHYRPNRPQSRRNNRYNREHNQ